MVTPILNGGQDFRRAGGSGEPQLSRLTAALQRVKPPRSPVDAKPLHASAPGLTPVSLLLLSLVVKTNERVSRFSVSLPPSLLRQLDEMTRQKSYDNRSLAIADMIRDELVEHRQRFGKEEIVGTITLVYDHHKRHVQESLTDIQHDHHEVILSTVHAHLDHHNCLEVLLVRGRAEVIRKIADELIAARGVKHGKLTVTTTGKNLPS